MPDEHGQLPFVVSLGDFIDSASQQPPENEIEDLKTIARTFAAFKGDIHHVIGNHDVIILTKEEFLAECGSKTPQRYYSFDHGNECIFREPFNVFRLT